MSKTYTHLTLNDRITIQLLLDAKLSVRAIARTLSRAPSTLTREFKHNGGLLPEPNIEPKPGRPRVFWGYCGACAQQRAQRLARKPRVARKMVCGNAVWERVIDALRTGLSPEQASGIPGTMSDPMRISHESIYTALHAMPRGHKTRRPRSVGADRRGLIPDATSIDERPIEVDELLVPGHWEGDLIKGARNKSQIGTLVERTTLFTMLVQLDNATAERFASVLNRIDAAMCLSMTYDNGREMAQHKALFQASGIEVYLAHPYSPWERGHNENTNGLLRRVLPKGTDLSIYTQEQLDAIVFHHNAKPRKCFQRKSPAEMFLPEGTFSTADYWSKIVNSVALGA